MFRKNSLASSWRPATILPHEHIASLGMEHLAWLSFVQACMLLEFSAMSPQNQNCTSESAVRYISHKQDHGSIYSIGSAAGSFVCGGWWWGKLAPPPFIGALPFDGGKGSKKLSMRWKTRPIRRCYLNFHQQTWKAYCGTLEKRGIKPYFLLFEPFATAAVRVKGRHDAASVRPLRHPSWTVSFSRFMEPPMDNKTCKFSCQELLVDPPSLVQGNMFRLLGSVVLVESCHLLMQLSLGLTFAETVGIIA